MIARILTLCLALLMVVNANDDQTNNGEFSSDLFSEIVSGQPTENVVMSPVSIQTCVAMAFFGAEGQTASEMVTGLHLASSNKEDVAKQFEKVLSFADKSSELNMANKIFLNKGSEIKPEYNKNIKNAFYSEADVLDFSKQDESVNTINAWVESKTNNKIQNLVGPSVINKDISMLLVNAIHFKASWSHKFIKNHFKDEFWMNNFDKLTVPMMRQTEFFKYGDFKNLDASAIEMPYENSNFSMMIVLPNERDGLPALETKLKTNNFIQLSSEMKFENVFVTLPKFKIEFSMNLNEAMKKLGMVTMYTDDADFSSLLDSKSVKVSDVYHKAVISVDENGTEAAAATYLKPVRISAIEGPPAKSFVADHPFVFLIKDNNSVYFAGHIVKF